MDSRVEKFEILSRKRWEYLSMALQCKAISQSKIGGKKS